MIEFNKPTLKRRDMDSVLQTMVNEQIGHGQVSLSFMSAFAEKVGCASAVAYRTYPDCLEDALKLYGAQEGTVVAISPLSPSVYKSVLDKLGCQIVMVDVDKENGMPREDLVMNSGASILMLYEPCGSIPLKYNTETTFADKCDYSCVSVIEDVSSSIGGHFRDEAKPGNWGKVVVCAFEDDSVIQAGGGAGLGVKVDMLSILRENPPKSYLTLTDLNSALGLVQLENIDDNCSKRREITKVYSNELAKTKHKMFGLNMLDYESSASCFPVFLDCKPEEVIKFAQRHEVPVRMQFSESVAKEFEDELFSKYPAAAAYYYRTVAFPVYPFLKNSEIEVISKIIAHLP